MAIKIYTDGSCGNTSGSLILKGIAGPGGWAAIVCRGNFHWRLKGGDGLTTSNRMELTAAIRGLRNVTTPSDIMMFADSKYVVDGMEHSITKWKSNGWKSVSKRPVKNQDLWKELVEAAAPHKVTWHWIKGHSGDPLNEKCDKLAKAAMVKASKACVGS